MERLIWNSEYLIATHWQTQAGRALGLGVNEVAVSSSEPKEYILPIVSHEISELWALNNSYLCPRIEQLANKYRLNPHEVGGLESVLQCYLFGLDPYDFYLRYRNFDYVFMNYVVKKEGRCRTCPYWYV